jgi:hypothetical protein
MTLGWALLLIAVLVVLVKFPKVRKVAGSVGGAVVLVGGVAAGVMGYKSLRAETADKDLRRAVWEKFGEAVTVDVRHWRPSSVSELAWERAEGTHKFWARRDKEVGRDKVCEVSLYMPRRSDEYDPKMIERAIKEHCSAD